MEQRATAVRALSLKELLHDAQFLGASDIRIASCSSDSRRCRPGDLFVALVGQHHDGHDHVDDAVRRGAVAVLASRPIPGASVPTCFVQDPRAAMGIVCQALMDNPSQRMRVIAVSGSHGKTTTAHLIGSILNAAGYRLGMLGSLGYCDGEVVATAERATPPAPALASWLARMEANHCTHAVIEVSERALANQYLSGVNVDIACVTNLRDQRLSHRNAPLRSLVDPARIFEYLAGEGVAVMNADCSASMLASARHHGPLVTVGIDHPAEITATPVEQYLSEQTFLLDVGSESATVRTNLIGAHNISNCLAAAGVGLVYGISLTDIVRGIESVSFVPGRMERLECGQPFGVFVDVARSAEALANCLDTVRELTPRRVICVFGAEGERDKTNRVHLGQVAETRSDVAVITADNPRGEDPDEIASHILSGFDDPLRANVIVDRAEAIRWALDHAQGGDCVVIAGKGHEDFQMIGPERTYFDDREVARHWLYESTLVDQLNRASA